MNAEIFGGTFGANDQAYLSALKKAKPNHFVLNMHEHERPGDRGAKIHTIDAYCISGYPSGMSVEKNSYTKNLSVKIVGHYDDIVEKALLIRTDYTVNEIYFCEKCFGRKIKEAIKKAGLVNLRTYQAAFRKDVSENFRGKGALLRGRSLNEAAHIIPDCCCEVFDVKPNDYRNGIFLYCEYHKLFDAKYFSFDEQLRVIISPLYNTLDDKIKNSLDQIRGKYLQPIKPILRRCLAYHRQKFVEQARGL